MSRWRRPVLVGSLLAAAGGLLGYWGAAAQDATPTTPLRGRIVDATGAPIPGLPVALHRVGPEGGANVAETVTDSIGRFAFDVDLSGAGGVFFAATRVHGAMYMGQPLRAEQPVPAEYTIIVGPGGNRVDLGGTGTGTGTAAGAAQVTPAQDGGGRGWAALLVVVVVALLGAGIVLGRRWSAGARETRRRELLAELAALEEEWQGGKIPDDVRERRSWLRSRVASLGT